MQNESKFSPEMINSLFQLMKNNSGNKQGLQKILNESLTSKQKEAVGKIMADPQKIKELLSSPQAKELIEKFGTNMQGDKKNGPA